MKLLLPILMLGFVAGCSDPVVEERTSSQSERYADFSYSLIAHSTYNSGNVSTEKIKQNRVVFSFTPSKFGAFMIVSGPQKEKVVLTDGPFEESVFEFGGINVLYVYWSDGKQIERTVIEIKYQ